MRYVRLTLATLLVASLALTVGAPAAARVERAASPFPTCHWVWDQPSQTWIYQAGSCTCEEGEAPLYPTRKGTVNNEDAYTYCTQGVQPVLTPAGGPVLESVPQPMPSVRE